MAAMNCSARGARRYCTPDHAKAARDRAYRGRRKAEPHRPPFARPAPLTLRRVPHLRAL